MIIILLLLSSKYVTLGYVRRNRRKLSVVGQMVGKPLKLRILSKGSSIPTSVISLPWELFTSIF